MNQSVRCGVLVVGHGSRREEANQDVCNAARHIAQRGNFALVEAAFLEIAPPDIHQGFARLVERGARHIIVHPYFLSPGRHTRGDIPLEVVEAARPHIGITYHISEPLTAHPLVIEASIERIREIAHADVSPFMSTLPHAPHETVSSCAQRAASNPLSSFAPASVIPASTPPLRFDAGRGKVYLVGAGPGDPGLLTIKARDLIASCDVVIYDYLVNPELLELAPARAERIYVGKVGGGSQTPQTQINRLLFEYARRDCRVVRLKGGDPFLFGRGGEECEALRAEDIEYEIVPGISSALAVPAYAGIPLTHRALSASVTILTGTHAGEKLSRIVHDAKAAETLVILMGIAHLREISSELIASGRAEQTPAAVIHWGTYQSQKTVTGTLRTIADEAEKAEIRAPSVIIIGEVVALRDKLKWFERSFEDSQTAYALT